MPCRGPVEPHLRRISAHTRPKRREAGVTVPASLLVQPFITLYLKKLLDDHGDGKCRRLPNIKTPDSEQEICETILGFRANSMPKLKRPGLRARPLTHLLYWDVCPETLQLHGDGICRRLLNIKVTDSGQGICESIFKNRYISMGFEVKKRGPGLRARTSDTHSLLRNFLDTTEMDFVEDS